MDKVLKAIQEADEKKLRQYLEAILKRREQMLEGGEILYREFSKADVERRSWIMERLGICGDE